MTDAARATCTPETEMQRLAMGGRFDIEVEIVNAGMEGAQFFAATIMDPKFFIVSGRQTMYGWGSGETIVEALHCAEEIARSHGYPEGVKR